MQTGDTPVVPVLSPPHRRLLWVLPGGSPVELARLIRSDAGGAFLLDHPGWIERATDAGERRRAA